MTLAPSLWLLVPVMGITATVGLSTVAGARRARRSIRPVSTACSVRIAIRADRVRVETSLYGLSHTLPRVAWVADSVTGSPWAFRAQISTTKNTLQVVSNRGWRDSKRPRLHFGPRNMSGWALQIPSVARGPGREHAARLTLVEVRPAPQLDADGHRELQIRLPSFGTTPVPLAVVVVDGTPPGTAVAARTCDLRGYGRAVLVLPAVPKSPPKLGKRGRRAHSDLCVRWGSSSPRTPEADASADSHSVDVDLDAGDSGTMGN